jgi:hypothetical protein
MQMMIAEAELAAATAAAVAAAKLVVAAAVKASIGAAYLVNRTLMEPQQ